MPLVSAIIIFLNAEKFIQEAIDSILAQSYSNWELLFVDDGSTDRSSEIALNHVQKYPGKVKYLEHPGHANKGMSASRNLGIRHAKGAYIAFLDSDDIWLPHKIERQLTIFKKYQRASMVYGATRYWYSWSGHSDDTKRDYVPNLGVQPDKLFDPPSLSTLLYPLGKGTAPCPSDIMVRRKAIERIGGFEKSFTGKYQLYEDQAFLAKMYLKEPVFVSSQCWSWYRLHPDSCMSTVKQAGHYHTVRLYFLNWLKEYLSVEGVHDIELWSALQNALSYYCDFNTTCSSEDS